MKVQLAKLKSDQEKSGKKGDHRVGIHPIARSLQLTRRRKTSRPSLRCGRMPPKTLSVKYVANCGLTIPEEQGHVRVGVLGLGSPAPSVSKNALKYVARVLTRSIYWRLRWTFNVTAFARRTFVAL